MNLEEILVEDKFCRETTIFDKAKLKISILYNRFAYKLKETAAIISGKKLANNKEYEGASRVSQEMVEANPRKWIIEECIPACEILWSKNIYTFMCSDSLDCNAWIELELDCLSNKNLAILEEIKRDYVCYQYHYGCLNISVSGMGKNAQEELINIANRFVMQDVPGKDAILNIEDVYMLNGCYKVIDNPKFVPYEEQFANMDFSNWGMPIEEPTILVLDSSKIIKSDEDYIADIGAVRDVDNGIIYRNRFHYNKHLKYIESLKNKGLR